MEKMKIAVASKNPAKIRAVSEACAELNLNVEVIAAETESGVAAQPFSLSETRLGAVNRATAALAAGADLAIGLEGGVYELEGILYLCNWGAMATADGAIFTAAGAQIPLPETIAEQLRAGRELGPVMDDFANETGVRKHIGAIGILTAGGVDRGEMFGHVVKLLIGQFQYYSG
ncbi:DUF84 family protein [Planococcus sp. CAU13]|uniref:DUF84 family protein n=1 Tax=Planococcus sp. CAU13 TaxID=1541197 RepID=UPI00052FE467|nr:DUF84 family protein [Planococcus sp. CAU13]